MDKLLLKSLDVNYLKNLCGSIVDLGNMKVRSRDAVGLGVPTVSSPVYVFIHAHEKQRFAQAIGDACPDHFLAISNDADRFLACAQPRKIHFEHVMEALGESEIQRVNVLLYGCKSSWPLFSWLDQVDVDFEVDLGHVLMMNTPDIHLVGKGSHVDIGGFGVRIWPMLTSWQRDGSQWMGSAYLQSPDRAHPIHGIHGIKVYPTVIHVVKGLATANFMSLPRNCIAAGRRRAEVSELLQQLKFRDYSADVSKVRVEVSMWVAGSLK